MVFLRKRRFHAFLLLAAMLALLFFISNSRLPQAGDGDCGAAWQPCFRSRMQNPLAPPDWVESDEAWQPNECPGQSFQAWLLLENLKLSMEDSNDILLEPYLQSWDQLLNFMDSLGSVVSFFSQKVKEKVTLLREQSIRHSTGAEGRREAYRTVRSMVETELKEEVVNFSHRTNSGCRMLLRLHRSLLWLKLLLEGLAEGPDIHGHQRTPGELSRDAYRVALAPHHPWFLRQAAEMVFLALPDRQYFLKLVCVQSQNEATPILRTIIRALTLVHKQTQQILAENDMLELP
ncbi:ceramide-1-phosphate transfer protein-like isoform X2 [Takifugu flavidus]|uniref:ceramide-1-phosphate transfer protein-like isoform X2 n=1 Tax=Takifugu flavidus TaxID=433684 RepID=UPI0025443FD3|nr:ceramide-1-phosphate transfer protein-like isoform X2 [Takifugu flavidus]